MRRVKHGREWVADLPPRGSGLAAGHPAGDGGGYTAGYYSAVLPGRRSARGPASTAVRLASVVLATVALSTFGCTDDLLDKQVLGAYDSSLFLLNEQDAIAALNAAYAPSNFTATNDNRRWVFGDVASDDVVAGGDGTQADILAIDQFTMTADNTNLLRQWRLGYEAITNANLVIARTPDISMDAALKSRIIGEAHFLRGYHYFELVIIFGGVPLITEPKSPEALQIARATQEQTYAQIEADLREAESRLGLSYPAAEAGRATRGAALGVLAKAQLYQQKWAAVLETVDAIESLGQYRLLDDFGLLFRVAGDNDAESIWELQHARGLQPTQGNYLNVWLAPRLDNGGFGFALPTENLKDAFEPGDPRLDVTLGYVGGSWFNGRNYIGNGLYSATNISQKKLIEGGNINEPRVESGLNVTYLRYGDIVLMEAEAAAETNDLDRARRAVNRIRARARAGNADVLPDVPRGLSQAELIDRIRRERRVELAVEMHRFFDIRRWGVAQQALAAVNVAFDPRTNAVFPIPQRELDVNPALRQNDGY